jgi:hypothetical protein
MTLSPVENDIYAVEIIGLISAGGYGHPATEEYIVYGKITENEEDGTYQLGIQTDQEVPTWGYGPCTIVGWHGPDGAEAIGSGEYIIGDIIDNNGAVTIEMRDEYGLYIFEGSNAGLYLDIVIGDGSSPTIAVWTRK